MMDWYSWWFGFVCGACLVVFVLVMASIMLNNRSL